MNLTEQLIRDEGCKLTCYKDSLGNWTVGVGHLCSSNIGTITQDQANKWLVADIAEATTLVYTYLPWSAELDPIRQNVLINMTFNMGIVRVLQFHHFLGYAQEQDWTSAAAEMLKSVWATQVGARANRLATQILTGEMQ